MPHVPDLKPKVTSGFGPFRALAHVPGSESMKAERENWIDGQHGLDPEHLILSMRAAGAEPRYLPPYSPDFDQMENAFSGLNAHVRKPAARTLDALERAAANALPQVKSDDCLREALGSSTFSRHLPASRGRDVIQIEKRLCCGFAAADAIVPGSRRCDAWDRKIGAELSGFPAPSVHLD